jgi:hypothetical protein
MAMQLDFEASAASLVDAMSFARRFGFDASALWRHTASLVPEAEGHVSILVGVAAFVVSVAPQGALLEAEGLAAWAWEQAGQLAPSDLPRELDLRREIAVALGSLNTESARAKAQTWIDEVAELARNNRDQEARAEAHADLVMLLVNYGNLPRATDRALAIERADPSNRAFLAILRAVGPRTWDRLPGWLRHMSERMSALV